MQLGSLHKEAFSSFFSSCGVLGTTTRAGDFSGGGCVFGASMESFGTAVELDTKLMEESAGEGSL